MTSAEGRRVDRRRVRGLNGASSILSQAFNSLTNLAVAALVAHSATPSQFGAWAVLLATYSLALQTSRALVITPVLVHEGVDERVPRWLGRQACSAAFTVGLAGSVVVVVTTLILPSELMTAGVLLAVGLPFLLVQDVLRNEAIRNGVAWWALCLDVLWAVVQVVVVLVLVATDRDTTGLLTGAWVLGGALGGLGGLVVLRRLVSLPAARSFAHDNREASLKLLAESVLSNGVLVLLPPLLAVVSGFAVAGAIRAGQTLFGPITLLMGGLIPLITTSSVLRMRRGLGVGRIIVVVSAATIAVSVALGVVVEIEPALGRALAGNSWPLVATILTPLVLTSALRGPIATVPVVMRARRMFNAVVSLRARTAVPALAFPLTAAAIWGLQGAAWGMAGAALVNTAQSARAYRRLVRDPRR